MQQLHRFGPRNILLLGALGTVGWALLLGLTWVDVPGFRAWELSWHWAACLALAAASRPLAVRIYRRARIALDSAFYIFATFTFGVISGAWLALMILTVDGVIRLARGSGLAAKSDSGPQTAAQLIALGGVPSLLIVCLGFVIGIDAAWPYGDAYLAWALPVFAGSFLVVHYWLTGGANWLLPGESRRLWRRLFVRVVVAELALVPLALAMVLGSLHQGIGLFLLLGATCLLFNLIFRRATISAESLRDRVEELSILNKVGRILAGSLERQQLVANIARETLSLVKHTSRFMIGTVSSGEPLVSYELFDESGTNYRSLNAPKDDGLSGWVMAHREALLLNNVRRQYPIYSKTDTYNDPRFQSWLGVPLVIYDEVMGVMSVQSEQANAYTPEHLRVLVTIADQAAVALENARLYELATVDGLTGLLVRRHFEQRLREEWSRSERYDAPFSLGVFDLDNFKRLNDTYGHPLGDHVLRAAAAVVRDNMRGADIAGRYGGEEFVFLLPRTSLAEAEGVAERIRSDIDKLQIDCKGQTLRVSASIGVASQPESVVASVADLVAKADAAMYEAKHLGKNRVCVSRPKHGASPPEALPEEGSLV